MPWGTDPVIANPAEAPAPVAIPPKASALTIEAPARSGGNVQLPPEADALYGRVRKAEGTAAGDGYVFYGGQPFKPGKDFPAWEGAPGPQRKTHAAGPGQWQPDTWNGLKPEFEKRFGREPDFSNDADQKGMTWLNAAKIYPGGEAAMQKDLAAGKLDTPKLASQWAGFGGPGGGFGKDPVTQAGKWKVSDRAVAFEQGRNNSSVVWMSPDDYLGMVPESDKSRPKRQSLMKSLELGDDIEAIPTLDAKVEKGRLKIFDQDGRNRAEVAKQEGVGLIPVAVHGVGKDAPGWVEDMRGNVRRFNFAPVPASGARTGLFADMPGLAPTNPAAASLAHGMAAQQRPTATPPAGVQQDVGNALHPPGALERFGTGVRDIAGGATQLASHMAPPGLVDAINGLNNALADVGVPLARVPEGGIDQIERQRAQNIEAERAARGETGTDWLRVAGQVAGTLPIGAAVPGVGTGIGGALATGAIQGAVGGAVAPVTEGDFWAEKAKGIALGGATGAGVGAGSNAAAALIAPPIRNAARNLADLGVRLTPGRLMGETASRVEDKLTSLPIIGDIMQAGMKRSLRDFNHAVYDQILVRVGQKASPKAMGYEGVAEVEQKLSAAYDGLKSKIHFQSDPLFERDLTGLATLAKEMPPDQVTQFKNILNNRVVTRLLPRGYMDGETFKQVESELSTISRQYHGSADAAQRQLADAVDSINLALRENLERVNPQARAELRSLNTAWSAFKRLQSAAARRIGSEGIFTPADLLAAERTMSGRARFARGDGLLRDIAQDAQKVLPSKYPDSGTAGRVLLDALAGGGLHATGALTNPAFLGAAVPASLAYLGPMMSLARLWARSPGQTRNAFAGMMRAGGKALAPTAGFLGAAGPPAPVQ